jgi:soluble lytic murein transglycosylase-like protein
MHTTTMRTTRADDSTMERAKRQLLGLGMLALTLSGGYFIAQRAVPSFEIVEEMEESAEDTAKPVPTLAEIMQQIDAVATQHHVSPRLVAAIIAVESEFNPRAVSRRWAQGLMQLMPATAAHLDVQDSFDTRENIEGGVKHLRVLMERYHNDLPLVLAAYNAGDTAVLTHRGIPPYRETRQYVIRVLRRYDREAAKAAARRIYGPGTPSTPRPSPALKTRLVSYDGAALPFLVLPPPLEMSAPEPILPAVEPRTAPRSETP